MQILVPALVALSVALLTHYFTSYRDRSNKLREQRINYMISAFRALAKASNHPRLYEVGPELEQALTDVQLLGSKEQLEQAHQIIDVLSSGGTADLDPLLASLRTSLRGELGAAQVDGHIMWLKVFPPSGQAS